MKKNLTPTAFVAIAALVVTAMFACNNGEAKKEASVDSPTVATEKPAEVSKSAQPGDTPTKTIDTTKGNQPVPPGGQNPPPPKK
jgi:short subunit fatty acids transporter